MRTLFAGRMHGAAGAAVLAFLVGCSSASDPVSCTGIGTRVGIGVDIAAVVADRAESAVLRTCWDAVCQDRELALTASTTVVASGCADGMCSAAPGATGGKNGFADIPELTARPVQVTLTLRDSSGAAVLTHETTLTPAASYPNGPKCGSDGVQAGLVVTSDGAVHVR